MAAAAAHAHLAEHTCRYGSPEQAKHQRASAASDVFALGATLYEALAGKPAFDAPTPLAVTLKITSGVHVSLDLAAPTAPRRLRSLVASMLSTSESERPRASEVAAALAEIAQGGSAARP
ncbi:MAG: protein kinase [Sandaracinaceae bacterium]|nr:protein kinase [Sandaracinaceae bacterium]